LRQSGKICFWLVLFLVWAGSGFAEISDASIAECQAVLQQQGFENLAVIAQGPDTLLVMYENRIFRNDMTAAGVVLACLQEKLANVTVLQLTPQQRAIPVCSIFIPLADYREFMAGRLDEKAFAASLHISSAERLPVTTKSASSFGRVDVTVRPGIAFQLGNYDDRFKINLNLQPELSTTLWRGGRVLAQAIVPVYDEMGIYTNEARLGRFTVSQWQRLPGDGIVSLSAGIFKPDRWGIAGEGAWFLFNRHVCVGAAAEYTGFLLYQNDYWHYSDWSRWTWRSYGRYYLSRLDLMISMQYADYLMQDHGWQFEATRVFRDAEIGVFMARTDQDRFGGVNLRIPLFPVRSSRPARVRVVSPGYMAMGYQATNKVYTTGAPLSTGVLVSSGNELLDFARRLLPSYIRNNLSLWKRAGKYIR
jgi:hypothetical protein